MKTVLLVRNAAKDDFGGAETYQISLASTLKDNSINPIIVTRSKKLIDYAKKHGIKTQQSWWWSQQNWTGKRTLLLPLYLTWQLILVFHYLYLIAKLRADALHLQSKDDFIAGTIAGRIARKRVVWTDHMDLRYIFENIEKSFRNIPGKLVAFSGKYAHHIILISDHEVRLVTSHFSSNATIQKRFVTIKNGVLDKRSELDDRRDFPEGTSFCIASRIVTNKGVGEAIEAFNILQKELPKKSLRLNIYGDGADLKFFKEQASNNQSIVFHGHQTDALSKIITNDVYMLPSYQEGFSIALLEATMLGMAIIASDVDSNGEIIKDRKTGLLVKPRDPVKLAKAMGELVNNKSLLHSLEEGARNSFLEHHDLEKITQKRIMPLYS